MAGVVVISGGSRGIGAATAYAAATQGYAVCVNYLSSPERAERVVLDIREQGGKALGIEADVSSEAEVVRMFQLVDRGLGPVTALVNNAGVIGRPAGKVEDITELQLIETFGINVNGTILCSREAIRRMSTAHGGEGGVIVNLSSVAARLGSPGEFVHYAASKGAIDAFTRGLAVEVAAEGIRVNSVRPGVIDTEIHDSSGIEGRVENLAQSIPMKRAGLAQEVAEAIVWLLSDEASYVSGAIMDVSGGR